MRKRPLFNHEFDGRSQHKFRRPHVVPALNLATMRSTHFDLNIIICKPELGNFHHWAVQLHNLSTGDGTVFEVQGVYPPFTFATYQCRRLYYPLKIIQTVHLKQFPLSRSAFDAITEAIEDLVPIDNQTAHWNSQDYVLDVLDMLEDEWWLEDDDVDYLTVRRKLQAMHGPAELVHKAVTAYPASPTLDCESQTARYPKDAEAQNARSANMVMALDGEG